MNCKICNSTTRKFGEATVLGKYNAEYDQCTGCGFISARQPSWLPEAYSSAITSSDLGTVSRTDQNSLKTKAVVDLFFNFATTFLDYGAGYGMFVRRMRDLGYNFSAYDLHCQNLFSTQFQIPDLDGKKFDLITAFEVFEHLEDPTGVFRLLLAHGDQIFFTTNLLPNPVPALADWWYYGPEHGQHISFYTLKALEMVAANHQRFFYTNGTDLHLFSRKRLSKFWFRKATKDRNSQYLGLWRRRSSLLDDDFVKNRAKILTQLGYIDHSVGWQK
jgi:hypothetical protein